MLEHLNPSPQVPARIVVMGANGFVGGAVVSDLKRHRLPMLELNRTSLDLLSAGASDRLAAMLKPNDVFIAVSAVAPCKTPDMLVQNMVIANAMVTALSQTPVSHLVNISSDAVYADSAEPLTESSPTAPTSLHGAMHLARELMFSTVRAPLAIVRPTLLYGARDPHNGYGPNRFRRLAAGGKDIVLFGDGEERRDHVDIEDVATLIRLVVMYRSVGIVNAAAGQVVSFRELAEFAASDFVPQVAVKTSPRSGPMPHNGYRAFDNRAVLNAFPEFRFKSWREGLSRIHADQKTHARRDASG